MNCPICGKKMIFAFDTLLCNKCDNIVVEEFYSDIKPLIEEMKKR